MGPLLIVASASLAALLIFSFFFTQDLKKIIQAVRAAPSPLREDFEGRKRYEQSVRVATVFFSVVMGFGLKHILEPPTGHGINPETDRWACFFIALLLFIRFLFGSANHLWDEYVPIPSHWLDKKLLIVGFCIARCAGICRTFDLFQRPPKGLPLLEHNLRSHRNRRGAS